MDYFNTIMTKALKTLLIVVGLFGFATVSQTATAQADQVTAVPPTPLQRVEASHRLMHHGLSMASEGTDLVMISQLGAEPHMEKESVKHGREAIRAGKDLVGEAAAIASGLQGSVDPAVLDYTSKLADSYTAVIGTLETMAVPNPRSEQMQIHQMHMLLNHALRMAADGANLRMIGTAERDVLVAELGGRHGTVMLNNARATVDQVLNGVSMQDAHGQGLEGNAMRTAHLLGNAIRGLIDLQDEMPVGPSGPQ